MLLQGKADHGVQEMVERESLAQNHLLRKIDVAVNRERFFWGYTPHFPTVSCYFRLRFTEDTVNQIFARIPEEISERAI